MRPRNVSAKAGNGEASFFFALFAFRVNNFRIHADDFALGIFSVRDVNHGDPLADSNLRRGQPHSRGRVH